MTTITFTVFGEPKTAGSKRAFYNPKIKRAIITDDNAKSRDWKEQVASAARQVYQGDLLAGPLRLVLTFYKPRLDSHFGTGRNAKVLKDSAPSHPSKKPDVLKLARCVEDSLTGVVWKDDAQIVDERLVKAWGEPARCEVTIEPLA